MRCLSNVGDHQARSRAASNKERLAALRETVEGLQAAPASSGAESQAAAMAPPQGLYGPDRWLPAGLPLGVLNEVVAAHNDRPAAFGVLFALTALSLDARAGPAVLVMSRRALSDFGAPYGHGLAQLGLDVGRLILVETETDKDALWALAETLRAQARPAMVAGALAGGVDLTSSRRLNLAAAPQRIPLVLLLGARNGASASGTSAAATRWRIVAAPAARDRFGALAAPRWHITLERSRLGSHSSRPGAWLIEWSPEVGSREWSPEWCDGTHRFRVVEGLADRPSGAGTGLHRAG